MRIAKVMLPLALAFVFCAAVQAADAKDPHWTGTLSAAPADAKGAAAVLTVAPKGKDKTAESKKYNLVAEGDVAKQITDFLAKSTKVTVKGTETGDSIKVTSVEEAKKKAPKPQ